MVPEVDCKLFMVEVEALKIDVFVVVACRVVMVPFVVCKVDTLSIDVFVVVARRVVIVPVVDCILVMVP